MTLALPQPRTLRLRNGMRAVFDPMPWVETVALGLYVYTGSRFERSDEQGLSHLLEHMAFKGTQRRTAREIAEEIEDVGGSMNAYTGRDVTAYHVGVMRENADTALDVLCDVFFDSLIEPDELAREQEVVIQEIAACEDMPDDQLPEHLHATAYPDQPFGRPIAGTRESVRAMRSPMLHDYMRRRYRPENTVLVASGAIDVEALEAAAEALCPFREGPSPEPAEPALYRGGDVQVAHPCEQAHVGVAFAAPPRVHPDMRATSLFISAAGGGMSSRLFQEIREIRGLAYSVYAGYSRAADTGTLEAVAACDPEHAEQVRDLLFSVLNDAAENLTERELNRTKACMRASLRSGCESSGSRSEAAALQMLFYDRLKPVAEICAEIDAVTLDAARAAGKAVLAGTPTVCMLGGGRK